MERILVPVTFVGGFIVGRNWERIVKFSKPYVKKGIKQSQKIASKSYKVVHKATSKGLKGAASFLGAQGKNLGRIVAKAPSLIKIKPKPVISKTVGKKSKRTRRVAKPVVAASAAA